MKSLQPGEITLDSLYARILRQKGGSREALKLLPKAPAAAGTEEGSVPPAQGEGE